MVHGQFPTVGDGQLLAHQVKSADLLADGMLHLQTRIDFQEVHFALFGHHEFAGAKPLVIDGFEQSARVGFQLVSHLGGKERCRRLFDKLLIAALHGAVARGIHGEVAVRVAAALRFDVTSFVDESFHEIFVQITALQRIMIHVETAQLVIVVHERDTATAAAIGTLKHERITVRMRKIQQQSHVGNRLGNAGNRRNFGERGHTTCGDLIPQIHEGFRIRTNPSRTRIDHFLRESGHFGKESVAWMHCVGTAALQNVDQQILVEIGVFIRVSGKQICVVSHLHVLCMAILLRVHRNRGNPHLTGGAHYAKRDFSAIRHQKFVDIFRHNVKFGRANEKS